MPYCKYCGSSIDSDAVFCTECGKQIKTQVPQVQAKQLEEQVAAPVTVHGGTISAEDVLKPDLEKNRAYMDRVARYRTTMTVLNQFYNQKEEWTDYDLELWAEMEEVMRKKYEISEISLFRFLMPERREPVQPQPERRRNKSYNKKNTEYWQKFDKKEEEK